MESWYVPVDMTYRYGQTILLEVTERHSESWAENQPECIALQLIEQSKQDHINKARQVIKVLDEANLQLK